MNRLKLKGWACRRGPRRSSRHDLSGSRSLCPFILTNLSYYDPSQSSFKRHQPSQPRPPPATGRLSVTSIAVYEVLASKVGQFLGSGQ